MSVLIAVDDLRSFPFQRPSQAPEYKSLLQCAGQFIVHDVPAVPGKVRKADSDFSIA